MHVPPLSTQSTSSVATPSSGSLAPVTPTPKASSKFEASKASSKFEASKKVEINWKTMSPNSQSEFIQKSKFLFQEKQAKGLFSDNPKQSKTWVSPTTVEIKTKKTRPKKTEEAKKEPVLKKQKRDFLQDPFKVCLKRSKLP